ncbi:MAG: hypothetical protein SPE38_02555 [Prevotella sp.]|nr:hypothetical protein [Prevotella sp.]
MLRFMGKTGINSSFFYAQIPDVLEVPDIPELPELPELLESLETSESPEHPESPRPDFFSSGINNKKTGNPCIHLLGQVRMRALGLSISVLFCLYKCGYARASC